MRGLHFRLTGPGGWISEVDPTADSNPVTLPLNGAYVLNVDTNGLDSGAYAFRLDGLNVTALTLGVLHDDVLIGTSDARLFQVETTEPNPLSIQFDGSDGEDNVELYVRRGLPPTRKEFGFETVERGSDHLLHVPFAAPGSWYILVYGTECSHFR